MNQKQFWEQEHNEPRVLSSLHGITPSGSLEWFVSGLAALNHTPPSQVLDLGCGKGRNAIALARLGYTVFGFDFVPTAIEMARSRAIHAGVGSSTEFRVASLCDPWPCADASVDIVLDCYSSIELDSLAARHNYLSELRRVLKSKALVLVAAVSADDPFESAEINASPGHLNNSAVWRSSGKFQKDYSVAELVEFYSGFTLRLLRQIDKDIVRYGQAELSSDIYAIFELR